MDPRDLTISDCFAAGHQITAWCTRACPGHDLDYQRLGRWADRKVLDLAREGVLVCASCRAFVGSIHISNTARADAILFWNLGDDAMPGA